MAAACLSEIKNIKLIESTESRLINCLRCIANNKLDVAALIKALAQAWEIELIDFQFSEAKKKRVAELVNLSYIGGLTHEKRSELDKYLLLDRLLDDLIRARGGYSVDFISF